MFKFNPLTGQFDQIECKEGLGFEFKKLEMESVDGTTVTTKSFDLGVPPLQESETFFLNGMAQNSNCYTITGTVLTLDSAFPLLVGDNVIINYASML